DKINKALEDMVSDKSWDKAVKDNFGPPNYPHAPAPHTAHI
ncbi:glutamate-binding protein, partial [Streptomyces althioticus]